jgi:peptidoglycan/LPS O-acetylase OafA/YrhL
MTTNKVKQKGKIARLWPLLVIVLISSVAACSVQSKPPAARQPTVDGLALIMFYTDD